MNDLPPQDPLAERERIIEEAHAAIEAYRKVVAESGLTPHACLEALRRAQGEGALQRVRQRVEARLHDVAQQMHHDAERRRPVASPSRHLSRGDAV